MVILFFFFFFFSISLFLIWRKDHYVTQAGLEPMVTFLLSLTPFTYYPTLGSQQRPV